MFVIKIVIYCQKIRTINKNKINKNNETRIIQN